MSRAEKKKGKWKGKEEHMWNGSWHILRAWLEITDLNSFLNFFAHPSFLFLSRPILHIMRDLSHLHLYDTYLYNNLSQFIHNLITEHNLFSINHRVEVHRYWFPFRMKYNQYVSLCLVALVLGQAASLPQYQQQFQQQVRDERKFAEKPNAMKKVALDDLDDISTNQIQVNRIRDASLYYKKIFKFDIFKLQLSKEPTVIKTPIIKKKKKNYY